VFRDPLRLLLLIGVVLLIVGTALHGVEFQRLLQDIAERPGSALAFRFFLQPTVSIVLAIRDGIGDARAARSAFLWSIIFDQRQRWSGLREGLRATGKIIVIAFLIDLAYQAIELRAFYPTEALITALLLGLLPYLLVRGPVARIARWWMSRASTGYRL
jgi:hypothetical protein